MSTPRKRILIRRPGSYSVFLVDETPIDDPPAGEIQVEVRACGVNFADVSVRLGLYAAARGKYPLCPGLEFAGVVSRIGSPTAGFRPGDKVFGVTRFGGYASAINCPPEHLWPLPSTWDFGKGATFPVAYLTAYHALHHVGHLSKSDKVLVHYAAGGVGTALLHLLRKNGNFTVGVVGRSHKVVSALEAGAKFVIDKSSQDLWKTAERFSAEGYDVILDANGASTLKGSYQHLCPRGRLLIYGFASMFSRSGRKNYLKLIAYYLGTPRFSPFELTRDNRTISGFNLVYLFDKVELFRRAMHEVLSWEGAGDLLPMPVSSFPFEDVIEAHKAIETGNTVGKLALLV